MRISRHTRAFARILLVVMVLDTITPSTVYALTSGPSQPEVQGFTPANAPEMVDLFTGDASYNIPLMDVEGYPINLSYKAGIGMDQEASWVGLGWNLSPGQVERSVRGIPDDFDGDPIERDMNLRPNRTIGTDMGLSLELFGLSLTPGPLSLGLSVSPSFNNYDGVRFEMGANVSMRSTQQGKSGMTAGLGVSASSSGSLTVQPSIGYDKAFQQSHGWGKGGLNFGMSINSKDGLQDMSFGASVMRGVNARSKAVGTSSVGKATFDLSPTVYSPEVSMAMDNLSISARVAGGVEAWGTNLGMSFGGFYSRQKLVTNHSSRRAYGYLNLHHGENDRNALLDFSREKDGTYSSKQSFLPVSSLANDFFSVTSQNMSGSYRAYRSAVGHVFDAQNSSQGSGGSAGVELGAGALAHFGGDVIVNEQTSISGDWTTNAPANPRLKFGHTAGKTPETVFFREASEAVVDRDPAQFTNYGGTAPCRLQLNNIGGYNAQLAPQFDNGLSLPPNALTEREPRATVFSYLTDGEVAQGLGLENLPDRVGSGLTPVSPPPGFDPIPDHHISEISITGKDGSRNFYGLPAYNIEQSDVSFAINELNGSARDESLTGYDPADPTLANAKGKDHFYSKNTTPRHAYAYLLTAAVSADYSDMDGIKGPSDGDLGTWTRFKYSLADGDYHWRTPAANGQATSEPGLAYARDDRAVYSYGRKEIWHLRAVESRNMVAVFFTSNRLDAQGIDDTGAIHAYPDDHQVRLDSVGLYTKEQLSVAIAMGTPWPAPIKTAHFVYDYSLCPYTPNSGAGGKLTLRSVYFTYGKSRRGETSPYRFQYGEKYHNHDVIDAINPKYEADCQDRWGGLRPNEGSNLATTIGGTGWDIPVKDFPYAAQEPNVANRLARAWNLTKVQLPSGGILEVAYESDDYGYVQDQKPTTMVRLTGVSTSPDVPGSALPFLPNALYLKFKVPPGATSADISQMVNVPGPMYFRMKVDLFDESPGPNYDYISGYAEVDGGAFNTTSNEGWVRLKPVDMDGDAGGSINPLYRSMLEFSRLSYPNRVYQPDPSLHVDDNEPVLDQLASSIAEASLTFMTGWTTFLQTPNEEVSQKNPEMGNVIDYTDSYIRLLSPEGVKRGGGHRVRTVLYSDGWEAMTGYEPEMTYGSLYTYKTTEGSTSGVAAYEPMAGADENCLRRPVYYDVRRALTPDDRVYQEEPFAESLYPSPVVGYSRVTVSDILEDGSAPPTGQSKGTTVHEFYTANDFPVRASRTSINEQRYKPAHFNLLSLLGFKTTDNMHVSQGFSVEVNDMHGKPRSTAVYPEGSTDPVSKEEYIYATTDGGAHISNTATVIEPDGTVHTAEIGRHYEFLADLREFSSDATSSGVALNNDVVVLLVPADIFVPFPKFSSERTRFKSATFVKKIQRFALLSEIVRTQSGRTVKTANTAYDAITGNVLVTRVQNDYKDPVYSMTFPAYWYYDGMGPGFQNIGAFVSSLNVQSDGTASGLVDINKKFTEGDEVICQNTSTGVRQKGWVEHVTASTVRIIDALGGPIATATYNLKVTRSGRRNMPSVPMASISTLSDPLTGLGANSFAGILNAQVIEYGNEWPISCECVGTGQVQPTTNPFILGLRGNWRLHKERAWLTERERSTENHNSNIRKDGVYSTYDPFYKIANGTWTKDEGGWVTTREVTGYSVRGQEIENLDALGIASSATFGRRGTLVKSLAKNSFYREQGFDDFEDPVPFDCGDRHFRFMATDPHAYTTDAAHSGRHSLRVTNGSIGMSVRLDERECTGCGCTFALSVQDQDGVQVLGTGGTAPFTFNPVVIAGTLSYNLLSGGNGVSLTGTGTMDITATDATGCQSHVIVQMPIP